jgi:probable addiction module antidote protein
MTIETIPFDAARYLDDPESQAELIADALESGDATYIAVAIGVVARARGMSEVARESGVTRAALYKAFGPSGDPKLTTLVGVLKSLGLKLSVKPEHASAKG